MSWFRTTTLNGKKIGYTADTEFLVQVGKGKGSYKTVATFKGDVGRAVMHYVGINVHSGGKKRLLMPSDSRNPVLVRQTS